MDELLPIFVKIQSNWWIDVFLPPLVTGILTGSIYFRRICISSNVS